MLNKLPGFCFTGEPVFKALLIKHAAIAAASKFVNFTSLRKGSC